MAMWNRGPQEHCATWEQNLQGGKESGLVHLPGKWMDEEVVSKGTEMTDFSDK